MKYLVGRLVKSVLILNICTNKKGDGGLRRHIIGGLWNRRERIGVNANFEYLFEGVIRISILSDRAEHVLKEAQRVNNQNLNVQKQLDDFVANSGTSDIEVVQARGEHDLLNHRLNHADLISQQTDFTQIVKDRIGFNRGSIKKIDNTMFEVSLDNGMKNSTYRFTEDLNDDFRKLTKVYVGDLYDFIVSEFDAGESDITGNWNGSSKNGNNWYTQDTSSPSGFTGYVTGEKINFMSMIDNRGGIWEFILNDDPGTSKKISVYSSSAKYNVTQTIADNLPYREHKVTAVFKGDDPNNAPSTGVGTARGWMYTNPSEDAYNTLSGVMEIGSSETKRLLVDGSNKEFAFNAKYNGQEHWLPEHSGVGTVFYDTPLEIYSDGRKIDYLSSEFTHSIFFSELRVTQKCVCRISNTNIANLKITHTFNMDGACAYSAELKAIESFEITDGYPLMMPLANETFDTVISGLHNKKISRYDGSLSYFELEEDKVSSYAGVDKKSLDFIVACKIEAPIKSMRLKDFDGHKPQEQKMLFNEREDFPKLYYHSMFNKSMTIGEVYNWSAQIVAAEIKDGYGIIN
ncbi:hypothetical protein [Salinicoccus albus]|uniref:hypothetical protein n=1 Tax=Salinicoccus albus TaxID=418756 RepID=UPI000376EFB9|nr:hypothetical protein [Salinicoccus albus]